jgi:transcription elongation factor GreB
MGRYRPPPAKSSRYITREGFHTLQEELEAIWKKRTIVTRALSAAAAEGDRSENAEYIYRKKELREIDRRIRYLQKRLPQLQVVSQPPSDRSRVYFGAWVTLENDTGEEITWRIVGPDESDPSRGWISMDAPVSRAMMKKTLDDEIVVRTVQGETRYYINGIDYQEPA